MFRCSESEVTRNFGNVYPEVLWSSAVVGLQLKHEQMCITFESKMSILIVTISDRGRIYLADRGFGREAIKARFIIFWLYTRDALLKWLVGVCSQQMMLWRYRQAFAKPSLSSPKSKPFSKSEFLFQSVQAKCDSRKSEAPISPRRRHPRTPSAPTPHHFSIPEPHLHTERHNGRSQLVGGGSGCSGRLHVSSGSAAAELG